MSPELDLNALIQEHRDDLWWYLRSLGADAATAEDIAQEAFLALMTSAFEARHPRATFAWLRTTARNRYVSWLRRRRLEAPVADDNIRALDEIDALWMRFRPDERLEALKIALAECMTELTDRAREAVLLRFQRGHKTHEIAAASNVQPAAVTKLLQRAKQTLRECLERRVPR